MSEVLLPLAERYGLPAAVMAFAIIGYYKLSTKTIDQALAREEAHRQDSKEREAQMRETIRLFSSSTEKMNVTLGNINGNMIKIDNNQSRNNKILEQICLDSGIKVISGIGGGGNGDEN